MKQDNGILLDYESKINYRLSKCLVGYVKKLNVQKLNTYLYI